MVIGENTDQGGGTPRPPSMFPDSPKTEEGANTHLLLVVDHEKVHWCLLDTGKKSFSRISGQRIAEDKYNENGADQAFLSIRESAGKPRSVSAVIVPGSATLVPDATFDPTNAEGYLDLNLATSGEEPGLVVKHDHLPALQAYSVYSTPRELIDPLHYHFPYSTLFHRSSTLIHAIVKRHLVHDQNGIFVYFSPTMIDILIPRSGRLEFWNSFQVWTAADAVYYILATRETMQLNIYKTPLFFAGKSSFSEKTIEELSVYFRTIEQLTPDIAPYSAPGTQAEPLSVNFLILESWFTGTG